MRYPPRMDHDDTTPRPVPVGWLEAMAESDADLAAGRIVPAAVVHAELCASIARLEAAQLSDADQSQQGPRHSAVPSRP
jgi:hypothetical protein